MSFREPQTLREKAIEEYKQQEEEKRARSFHYGFSVKLSIINECSNKVYGEEFKPAYEEMLAILKDCGKKGLSHGCDSYEVVRNDRYYSFTIEENGDIECSSFNAAAWLLAMAGIP